MVVRNESRILKTTFLSYETHYSALQAKNLLMMLFKSLDLRSSTSRKNKQFHVNKFIIYWTFEIKFSKTAVIYT